MMSSLKDNKAIAILDAAAKGYYAVPAVCCYNLEGILAVVRASECKRSPAMILLFPWAFTYANNLLVNFAADACRSASVPITLHLDHAQEPEIVRRAADTGKFDSIMIDMSHYDKEENLAKTKELVAYCNERGIATEAEPGRIEGGEDGLKDTADLEGLLTRPEEAREFVDTGIDWLAPAFGNVHGSYGSRGVQLEYNRLEEVNKAVGDRVRLVLHGTDTFTEEIYKKCIEGGITKANINKEMNLEYVGVMKEMAGKATISGVMEAGTAKMQEKMERMMDWLGSSGKAE
ncbi:MAG: hypothetical protein M1834_005744 [Cirrosporium novae-zelandiae]|nr:MAG: hypothetical protein M1834_005744 [Cirrosporium novae-zelandiae]